MSINNGEGFVNCFSSACDLGLDPDSDSVQMRNQRELGARGMPLQGCLNRGHGLVPITLEGPEVRAESAAEGGQRALAGRELRESGIRAPQQVEERQECRGY